MQLHGSGLGVPARLPAAFLPGPFLRRPSLLLVRLCCPSLLHANLSLFFTLAIRSLVVLFLLCPLVLGSHLAPVPLVQLLNAHRTKAPRGQACSVGPLTG
jgi:hypothetical protein